MIDPRSVLCAQIESVGRAGSLTSPRRIVGMLTDDGVLDVVELYPVPARKIWGGPIRSWAGGRGGRIGIGGRRGLHWIGVLGAG